MTLAEPALDGVRAVADAVLYEGYVLYPYRRSSTKNAVRWQFGVLSPRRWIEAQGPVVDGVAGSTEWWWQQTECLLDAPETATVRVCVRHLQVQSRSVLVPDGHGWRPVDRLEVDDRVELAFDEAVPRETDLELPLATLAAAERTEEFCVPGGALDEDLCDASGAAVGRVHRERRPLQGTVKVGLEPLDTPYPAHRLRVRVENSVANLPVTVSRPAALRHSMVATHCVLEIDDGCFWSLLEPPRWAEDAARTCHNVRTYPVLCGTGGSNARTVLSSPIILYDHPRIAPESPGDLHEGGEIDELLSLRTRLLTEEEKREARATDPRVAALIDRVDQMPPEVLERLHGTIRSRGSGAPAAGAPDTPWWDPGADRSVSPERDHVVIDGVRVARGARVRLHPRKRGTDAHDMFFAGHNATVEAVFHDVDESIHVAVTIDDDPSAELHQWYGRYHYYRPEELEPLPEGEGG